MPLCMLMWQNLFFLRKAVTSCLKAYAPANQKTPEANCFGC